MAQWTQDKKPSKDTKAKERLLVEAPMDLGQKTPRRPPEDIKTKTNVGRRPNGFRIEDP